jgi:isoamylase
VTKETGRSSRLRVILCPNRANFSGSSKHATKVELLLFDGVDNAHLRRVIPIDPATKRTYHYWHIFESGVKAGQIYGYRVSGAFDPSSGMCFDPATLHPDGHWVHFNAYASQAKPEAMTRSFFRARQK